MTPEIIDDVATNLRLGVVHPSRFQIGQETDEDEVRKAARTLLDLYARLQRASAPRDRTENTSDVLS